MTHKPTLKLEGEDVVLRIHAPNFVAFEKRHREFHGFDDEHHAEKLIEMIRDGVLTFLDIVEDPPLDAGYLHTCAADMAAMCIHDALQASDPALVAVWEIYDYNEHSRAEHVYLDVCDTLPEGLYPARERLRCAIECAVDGRYEEARANIAKGWEEAKP